MKNIHYCSCGVVAVALFVHGVGIAFSQLFRVEFFAGEIGRGGMGMVYKARQPKLNRLVALKILAPEKGVDPKFAERFLREAQALARHEQDFTGLPGGLAYEEARHRPRILRVRRSAGAVFFQGDVGRSQKR